MASSSYYKGLMDKYWKEKEEIQTKHDDFSQYLTRMRLVNSGLDLAVEDLKGAESDYLNGGYNDAGNTFDYGELKKNYTLLQGVIDTFDSVDGKLATEIGDLYQEICKYNRLYREAKSNYEAALAREKAETAKGLINNSTYVFTYWK